MTAPGYGAAPPGRAQVNRRNAGLETNPLPSATIPQKNAPARTREEQE